MVRSFLLTLEPQQTLASSELRPVLPSRESQMSGDYRLATQSPGAYVKDTDSRNLPPPPHLEAAFTRNRPWESINLSFFLSFWSLNMGNFADILLMSNQFWTPGINPSWSGYVILSYVFLDPIC